MPTMYLTHLSKPPNLLSGHKKRGVVSGFGALGCWLSSAVMQSLGKMDGLLGLASEKMERHLCLAGPGLVGVSALKPVSTEGNLI